MPDQHDVPPPKVVASYASGVQARAEAAQAAKRANPIFPNLAQAAVMHRPEEGRTLADHAAHQKAGEVQERRQLSQETVEGLQVLHAQQVEAQAKKEKPAEEPAEKEKTLDNVSLEDEQFADALRQAQRDVINNKFERDAVTKRVKEIDLAEGLVTGEFTQLVPIVPDKLEVRYRCLTSGENNEIRLLLLAEVDKDGQRGAIVETLLGFYQLVATVMSINRTEYARHMVPAGPYGRLEFKREIFMEKVHAFMAFPMPLISALGTHSAWFEQRVRQLFATSDTLKNG